MRAVAWFATIAVAAAVSLPGAVPSHGAYPDRPVTVIVPWPAGGSTDIAVRAMTEVAAKHLGQPIIVENKAGASGTLGPATMAATAKPDGYTVAQMPVTVQRQTKVAEKTSTAAAWAEIGKAPAILEGFISFDREISVIAARGWDGAIAVYDVRRTATKTIFLRHQRFLLILLPKRRKWHVPWRPLSFGLWIM